MKSPIDTIKGTITDYDERSGMLTIKAPYQDYFTLIKRDYKHCNVQLVDSRPLSEKQRNACYALLRDIAEFTGEGLDPTKEYMKIKFLAEDLQETGDKIFSLSNAPMSLVCAFQRFIVKFILDWDIPTKKPLLDMVDDLDDYIYNCLVNKKCCICGEHTDLHHCSGSRVGMGHNRDDEIHEGREVLPLCRIHHSEIHLAPEIEFFNKYHLEHGIIMDKALCKLYHLKAKKKAE